MIKLFERINNIIFRDKCSKKLTQCTHFMIVNDLRRDKIKEISFMRYRKCRKKIHRIL